jgi:predicted nucleotidyltransferase
VVSPERRHEVDAFITGVEKWAATRSDLAAVAVVGSWARGAERQDSDLDLVLLTQRPSVYVEGDERIQGLAPTATSLRTGDWGEIVERRLILPSGLEIEVGIGHPSWADSAPVDPGTKAVVRNGLCAVYDPRGLLAELAAACRKSP